MRGITSRVDIIWRIGYYTEVKRRVDVTASIVNSSAAVYTDQLVTPPLSVNDSGRVYYCVVNINATFWVTTSDTITLRFNGKL